MVFDDEKLRLIARQPNTELEGKLARFLLMQREVSRGLEKKLVGLGVVARRIVSDRGCICNKPRHRCGTNQMYEDIESIVKADSAERTNG